MKRCSTIDRFNELKEMLEAAREERNKFHEVLEEATRKR